MDLREQSPYFGKWFDIELSSENHLAIFIPEGFAHGFIALEDNTQFLYKTTNYYNKKSERGIVWNDPAIAIEWPIGDIDNILVSNKDAEVSTLNIMKGLRLS